MNGCCKCPSTLVHSLWPKNLHTSYLLCKDDLLYLKLYAIDVMRADLEPFVIFAMRLNEVPIEIQAMMFLAEIQAHV